jgi:hypothetical protein
MAAEASASHVVLDSLKDAAVPLSADEVGARYPGTADHDADGRELELHHPVKFAERSTTDRVADMCRSRWIGGGAGG